jgi:hypothetical protein
VTDFEPVWERIRQHSGHPFKTKTGLEFTYAVPGAYLRITRNGKEIERSLSKSNFAKAAAAMPVEGPGDIKDRQGQSYTWAILMDRRIRARNW